MKNLKLNSAWLNAESKFMDVCATPLLALSDEPMK